MSIMMTTMMMKVPSTCSCYSHDDGDVGDDDTTADVASSLSSSFSSLQRRKRRKCSFRSSSHHDSWHNNIHKTTTTLSLLILLSFLLLLTTSNSVFVIATADDQSQDEESSTSSAVFVHKTVIIPHDSKKHRGGEDSASTSDHILVVADGVGGWAKSGINPGLYSRELTKQIVHKYEGEGEGSRHDIDLKELVNDANWIAASKHKGSATCTVVELLSSSEDNGKSLRTLNVGDSGYSIHRWTTNGGDKSNKLEVVFASEPGQKRFNFPFQLGGQYGHDVKEVGVPNQHTLQPNDIIIVYSDGVSDNLYPIDYHDCLLDGSIRGSKDDDMDINDEIVVDWPSLSWIADCIARQAYMKGKDKSFLSPFAIGARESGFRKDYIGGKHDDITVTVAQVVDNRQIALERTNKDKYFDDGESIYLYEGHVKSKQYMPKLDTIIDSPGRLVGVGGGDDEGEL